ncbi:MAG: hypothetical protein HYU39_00690 [Thaumarchaeota archaeon]|nr:hypothetical protein [Nitrososphaerota archaeon]
MYGAYIGGIFPRSERLIEATRVKATNLLSLYKEEKRRVVELQAQQGFTYIADPMEDWDDMLRPFLKLEGIQEGPLDRFYENNTFYRKPIIINKVKGPGNIASTALALNLLPKKGNWKASLPDPYTFADLSENRHYADKIELMFELAKILSQEVASLASAGVKMIQLNGPSIVAQKNTEDLRRIGEAIQKTVKGRGVETYLHLYFKNASKIIPKILDFNVDGLGIDFVNTPLKELENLDFKGLACGIVDSTNTKMETPKEIASFVENVLETLEPKQIYLTPNCDLEHIPYTFAKQKVRNMGRALELLRGE